MKVMFLYKDALLNVHFYQGIYEIFAYVFITNWIPEKNLRWFLKFRQLCL
jgi:hypothetical protein